VSAVPEQLRPRQEQINGTAYWLLGIPSPLKVTILGNMRTYAAVEAQLQAF